MTESPAPIELNADTLFQSNELRPVAYADLPHGRVYVRTLNVQERVDCESRFNAKQPDARAHFLWMTVCNSAGERLYTRPADVALFQKMNGVHAAAIQEAAEKLNGYRKSDVDDAEKKSAATEDSGSD